MTSMIPAILIVHFLDLFAALALVLSLIACVFGAVCLVFAIRSRTHKTPAAPAPQAPKPPAAPVRTDLVRVLRLHPTEGWQHAGWAQEGSGAHDTALAAPGYAVQLHNGEIHEGKQV